MDRQYGFRTLLATDGLSEGLLARPAWSPDGRSIAVILVMLRPRGPTRTRS